MRRPSFAVKLCRTPTIERMIDRTDLREARPHAE
jgi:hypothetical protein